MCCLSNATRAPIANPPNSAQLGGSLYHASKLHPGPCSNVGVRPRTDTHTQTDTQTRVTTIHFASSTTHAKCNNFIYLSNRSVKTNQLVILSVDLPHIYTLRVIISTTRPFRAATTIENQQDAICHLDSVLISTDLY